MHDPDVLAAFAVGNESDPLTIRRELRLAVKSHAAVDQLGLAAFNGKRVDISDQLECDGLAVGRDVQRKPRALISGKFNLSVGLEWQTFFLVFLFILLLVLLYFVLILFLLCGILPFCAGVQGGCAFENNSEDHCQNNEPRGQTAQAGLLSVHAGFPPYLMLKLLTWGLRIGR